MLNPYFGPFPTLYTYRGLKFDLKFQELLLLIRDLARLVVKEALEGKRDDDKFKTIMYSYRKIAFLLEKEDIDGALYYIQNEFKLSVRHGNRVDKLLKQFSGNQIIRWVVSVSIFIIFCLIIYLIARLLNFLNDDKASIWVIFGLVIASFPAVSWIKTKIMDWLMDNLAISKK